MKEKLDYEYEIFYLDCMRQSKPGVYARSAEIESKKNITALLKEMAGRNPDAEKNLMALDNILEDAYRYVEDHRGEGNLKTLLERWLDSLV